MATKLKKPEPLKISCTATDCENDLHCFKATRGMSKDERGKCRACSADLVDWKRVHKKSIKDAAYTFEALKNETIRHHFFHTPIDQHAINHARRKGRVKLAEAARSRVEKCLAPAEPKRDGRQTPFAGNTIYYAQHATACCCRTCLEYWHDIPKGRPLTAAEIEYCSQLIDLFIDERLPNLENDPVRVPPIRKR